MKIACLGWGSLIWDPKWLPVRKPWFIDGPLLPIEFARQSKDNRITLVINWDSNFVRVLWALMYVNNITHAKSELAKREGIPSKNIEKDIGWWKKGIISKDMIVRTVSQWAISNNLDCVVWTNLSPKFDKENRTPQLSEVIEYLENLTNEDRKHAEEYIRKAPAQIDTFYRRSIELKFGWAPGNHCDLFNRTSL